MEFSEVIRFWFNEVAEEDRWTASDELDARIAARFGDTHAKALKGELWSWRADPLGQLAEIILLDQFSRNIYRGRPQAFQADSMALVLAQEAVASGADRAVDEARRLFFYLPYMHSESREIHAVALDLFRDFEALSFEESHKAVIDRFGRYPHRNAILGRANTPEEEAFLKEGSESWGQG